jgi:hypothetical protein
MKMNMKFSSGENKKFLSVSDLKKNIEYYFKN